MLVSSCCPWWLLSESYKTDSPKGGQIAATNGQFSSQNNDVRVFLLHMLHIGRRLEKGQTYLPNLECLQFKPQEKLFWWYCLSLLLSLDLWIEQSLPNFSRL